MKWKLAHESSLLSRMVGKEGKWKFIEHSYAYKVGNANERMNAYISIIIVAADIRSKYFLLSSTRWYIILTHKKKIIAISWFIPNLIKCFSSFLLPLSFCEKRRRKIFTSSFAPLFNFAVYFLFAHFFSTSTLMPCPSLPLYIFTSIFEMEKKYKINSICIFILV